MDDYGAWFAAFSEKLQALPPAERQHSSLPILHQWAEPIRDWERDRVDASQFCRQVRGHKPAGETEIPHLDEGFLHKYLADMRALEVLKA
jgi:fatty acid CoA ligase FadD9